MAVEIKVTGLTEQQVEDITAELVEESGLMYDEDFTTLYGAGWEVIGIKILSPRALDLIKQYEDVLFPAVAV